MDKGFWPGFVVGGLWLSRDMEAISAVAIGVEDLDDSALLEAASEAERWDRMVQRRKLQIAYEWCVRHPATAGVGYGDLGRCRPSRSR